MYVYICVCVCVCVYKQFGVKQQWHVHDNIYENEP